MGVWIETAHVAPNYGAEGVTPFVGVWIETDNFQPFIRFFLSHPSWVCGLKLPVILYHRHLYVVTPFVGVWIETCCCYGNYCPCIVTPFVGVWIETGTHLWCGW